MRFDEPAYPTTYFSKQIWVYCPDCNDLGLISTKLGRFIVPYPTDYSTRFHCTSCQCQKSTNEEWFGHYQGIVRQACGFCGTMVYEVTPPTRQRPPSLQVTCSSCKRERTYRPKWKRFSANQPTDPFFGLDLWLQVSVRNKTLWVYNLNHLNYLRKYVSATLRGDDRRHKYSLITKLPSWIKSAKNRGLIVRKLDKLEIGLKNLLKQQ